MYKFNLLTFRIKVIGVNKYYIITFIRLYYIYMLNISIGFIDNQQFNYY